MIFDVSRHSNSPIEDKNDNVNESEKISKWSKIKNKLLISWWEFLRIFDLNLMGLFSQRFSMITWDSLLLVLLLLLMRNTEALRKWISTLIIDRLLEMSPYNIWFAARISKSTVWFSHPLSKVRNSDERNEELEEGW